MAKNKIRGITIEIGGDTSGLSKSLQSADKSIKNTQTQLKDVNKLLKLDPGNTELLTQKQKLLGDAVNGTKEKLATLKAANVEAAESVKKYDDWKAAHDPIQAEIDETKERLNELKEQAKQADEQLASGKISQDKYDALQKSVSDTEEELKALREQASQVDDQFGHPISHEQFDALQREIIDTEQDLKSLTEQMKDFGSVAAQQIADAGEKVKEFGGKVEAVGTELTKTVTVPIVGVATASVAAFNEVDEGLDIIVTKTGATGDALEDMEERAKNLATSIPTDFRTAGTAIGEVNTRFGATGDELEALSGKFIKFAQINGVDVNNSIDNVQAAMAAMNIESSHAGEFLDILNKAGQDTGVNIDKLTTDLTANATALREFGFKGNTAVGFLANLNKHGVDASSVMTGLKTALKNATANGQSMGQAMKGLTDKIKNAWTETEAMQIASELFGTKAGPALALAIREDRISFEALANAVEGAGDSIDQTFEATLDPVDDFKTALNELKIVGMDLVVAAAPLIQQIADMLKSLISGIREGWEGLSPFAQETIIKIAAIVAAVGPLLAVGGKVIMMVGDLMTKVPQLISTVSGLVSGLGGVIQGLWGIILANPIAALVAAVVGAFAYFYATSEEFREFVKGLWDSIAAGWEALKDRVKVIWGDMQTAYEEHGGGLEGIAAGAMKGIQDVLESGFDLIDKLTGGRFKEFIEKNQDVWKNVTSFVSGGIEKLRKMFDFHWELPKIKLPHFSISGSFSLNPPSVPHLSIEWYKKAMNDGMILTSPTILPAANGSLRGFGDAGPEAVVGVDSLRSMIREAVANNDGGSRMLTVIFQADSAELGRCIYRMNNDEVQRVGMRLAGGVG